MCPFGMIVLRVCARSRARAACNHTHLALPLPSLCLSRQREWVIYWYSYACFIPGPWSRISYACDNWVMIRAVASCAWPRLAAHHDLTEIGIEVANDV